MKMRFGRARHRTRLPTDAHENGSGTVIKARLIRQRTLDRLGPPPCLRHVLRVGMPRAAFGDSVILKDGPPFATTSPMHPPSWAVSGSFPLLRALLEPSRGSRGDPLGFLGAASLPRLSTPWAYIAITEGSETVPDGLRRRPRCPKMAF